MSSDDRVVPPPPPESLPPLPPPSAPPSSLPVQPPPPAYPPATAYPFTPATVAAPPAPARRATTVSPGIRVLLVILLAVLTISTATLLALLPMLSASESPALPVVTAPAEPSAPAPGSDVSASGIAGQLDATITDYKQARSNGELWQRIPDTPFNQTAVTAFLFFLTDMKIAAGFGVDDATAQEYAAESAELERRLLAEEPLGSDIHIDLGEGKVFDYDGDTGEGGWAGR